jgi:hypothetical protein
MRPLRIFTIALAGAMLVDPPAGNGCGPFLPEAQFEFQHNPGPEFFRGELGILRPQYYRRNLVVAWRYLSGVPIEPPDASAVTPVVPSGSRWNAADPWLKARNALPGVQPIRRIDTDKQITGNGIYQWYANCFDDAFDTAAATLADRVKRWGQGSANIAEWVHAQDQVFANCSGPTPVIPGPVPAGSDPLLAADRQYQVAAADFYAARFQDAEAAFRAVASNKASPWSDSAPYLIARTLIREGTLDNNRDALTAAENALREIVGDPRQQRWQDSAKGLLGFVTARLHPEARMVDLGSVLSKASGADFTRALTDYTLIFDRLESNHQPLPAQQSEITDWIHTFQSRDSRHALDRWRAEGTDAWLLAAIAPEPAGPAADELIAAARKLTPSSPAYATTVYHAISMEIALHRADDARQWADEALAANVPLDAHNAIVDERMRLARDWTDFLRFSLRRPVAAAAVGPDENISDYPKMASPELTFAPDTAALLNQRVPLDLWMDASSSSLLTPRIRAAIAQAGWVRAVILDRPADAREFARRTAAAQPALADGLRAYEPEKSPQAAKFAAVFLILRAPGLEPLVRAGFGRFDKVEERDEFRDNWWLLTNPGLTPTQRSVPTPPPLAADFLPPDQRAQGDREWQTLVARANTGPDFLAAETLKWARAHPDDPRVPEALHLVVRATHFGPGDAATSTWSKRAFQLLHSRYPSSPWAQATKYWY